MKNRNILYLHGLESKLSEEKRKLLEPFGNIIAPDMDYFSNPKMFQWLYETYKNEKIDCIIGSSMGGFMGYYLAMAFNCKSLLFNPALSQRSVLQETPEHLKPKDKTNFQLVLGWDDTVVSAKETLTFIKQNGFSKINYKFELVPNLGHQIPVIVFEEKVEYFLNVF